MSKRAVNGVDGEAAFRKRQKITHEVPAGEDVYDCDQLRKLLAFDQDLRHGRHGRSLLLPIGSCEQLPDSY